MLVTGNIEIFCGFDTRTLVLRIRRISFTTVHLHHAKASCGVINMKYNLRAQLYIWRRIIVFMASEQSARYNRLLRDDTLQITVFDIKTSYVVINSFWLSMGVFEFNFVSVYRFSAWLNTDGSAANKHCMLLF